MFVAQPFVRGRPLDLTAQVHYDNRNLHEQ